MTIFVAGPFTVILPSSTFPLMLKTIIVLRTVDVDYRENSTHVILALTSRMFCSELINSGFISLLVKWDHWCGSPRLPPIQ